MLSFSNFLNSIQKAFVRVILQYHGSMQEIHCDTLWCQI